MKHDLRRLAKAKGMHSTRKASGHRSDQYIWHDVKPDEKTLADAIDVLVCIRHCLNRASSFTRRWCRDSGCALARAAAEARRDAARAASQPAPLVGMLMNDFTLVSNNSSQDLPMTGVKHASNGCNASNGRNRLLRGTPEQLVAARPCKKCLRKLGLKESP